MSSVGCSFQWEFCPRGRPHCKWLTSRELYICSSCKFLNWVSFPFLLFFPSIPWMFNLQCLIYPCKEFIDAQLWCNWCIGCMSWKHSILDHSKPVLWYVINKMWLFAVNQLDNLLVSLTNNFSFLNFVFTHWMFQLLGHIHDSFCHYKL